MLYKEFAYYPVISLDNECSLEIFLAWPIWINGLGSEDRAIVGGFTEDTVLRKQVWG